MKTYIEAIALKNYRNFSELKIDFNNNIIVILGDNGSGKTNILESISLLSPGNGLRGAKYEEITKNQQDGWFSNILFQSKLGSASVKYNFVSGTKIRNIEYNGSKITNSELLKLSNIIWLTPQMDGIFLSAAEQRRRFLDRIVYNFYPEHASNINKYTKLTSQRLKVLMSGGGYDDSWLNILEQKISDFAMKISNMRKKSVAFLDDSIASLKGPFPQAKLSIKSLFEEEGDESNFLENYSICLKKNRSKDMITKRTNFGINKQELIVKHSDTNQMAKFCSTGQQKALLISILLGQIEANISIAKNTPILLLDELFLHLDDKRKDSLAQYIINSKLQTFITATDLSGIDMISEIAQLVKI